MFGKDKICYLSVMKKRNWKIIKLIKRNPIFQLLIFAVGVGLVLMFIFWVINSE